MPEQVPDFVTDIHELVNQKRDGALGDLGAAISDATPDDEAEGEEDIQSEDDEADT